MSGFDFTELGDSWGPWYGAPYEKLDLQCARLRDKSILSLKLWCDFSSKAATENDAHYLEAKYRAFRLMWSFAERWAACRRDVATRHGISVSNN